MKQVQIITDGSCIGNPVQEVQEVGLVFCNSEMKNANYGKRGANNQQPNGTHCGEQ
jgi:ribonuclease HI